MKRKPLFQLKEEQDAEETKKKEQDLKLAVAKRSEEHRLKMTHEEMMEAARQIDEQREQRI